MGQRESKVRGEEGGELEGRKKAGGTARNAQPIDVSAVATRRCHRRWHKPAGIGGKKRRPAIITVPRRAEDRKGEGVGRKGRTG